MSKKQRRNTSQASSAPAAQARNDSTVSGPNPALRRQPEVFEFNPDYSNTIKDLKQIGILAGSFVVILVVLSFILK